MLLFEGDGVSRDLFSCKNPPTRSPPGRFSPQHSPPVEKKGGGHPLFPPSFPEGVNFFLSLRRFSFLFFRQSRQNVRPFLEGEVGPKSLPHPPFPPIVLQRKVHLFPPFPPPSWGRKSRAAPPPFCPNFFKSLFQCPPPPVGEEKPPPSGAAKRKNSFFFFPNNALFSFLYFFLETKGDFSFFPLQEIFFFS